MSKLLLPFLCFMVTDILGYMDIVNQDGNIDLLSVPPNSPDVAVGIDGKHIFRETNELFIGITIDTETIINNWGNMDLSSKKIRNLGRALGPCYIRVGGTTQDYLYYNVTSEEQTNQKKHYMQARQFKELYDFVNASDWKLIFGLNSLARRNNTSWAPDNAVQLFKYIVKNGFKMEGFELGNEPYLYPAGKKVSASQHVHDFGSLSAILEQTAPLQQTMILGPDTTQIAMDYMFNFLLDGGSRYVDAITFHHYYFDSRQAKPEYFVDPNVFNRLKKDIQTAVFTAEILAPTKPVWLGETSSSFNRGVPGVSDKFIAGFLWLDKLGMSAKYGLDVVVRQSFYGEHYSLLDYNDTNPNPDFWLTLLYKRLVGKKVLNVTTPDSQSQIRIYAHCSRNYWIYVSKSVTFYGMNLSNKTVNLTFPEFPGAQLHVYMLQSFGDDGLVSRYVSLNGQLLNLTANEEIPNLDVPSKQKEPVRLPPFALVFVVIPEASVPACILK